MKRMDIHVHGQDSKCSRTPDAWLLGWFAGRQDYVPVVSNHMSCRFPVIYEDMLGSGRSLYAMEYSVLGPATTAPGFGDIYDLLLFTYDLDAFSKLDLSERYAVLPPLETMLDPRVIVVWAHPEGTAPAWMDISPPDYLELNSIRLGWQSAVYDRKLQEIVKDVSIRWNREIRFTVGSDSHQTDRIGFTYLQLDDDVETGREAWEALRDGRFTNVLVTDSYTKSLGFSSAESFGNVDVFRPDEGTQYVQERYDALDMPWDGLLVNTEGRWELWNDEIDGFDMVETTVTEVEHDIAV
jgi:hypothetical protein